MSYLNLVKRRESFSITQDSRHYFWIAPAMQYAKSPRVVSPPHKQSNSYGQARIEEYGNLDQAEDDLLADC
jgi:hypothetical protein